MNNAIDADQVYLPNSVQHLNMTEESLMLLWIFITINNVRALSNYLINFAQ
jgi:hypothetical protein